MPKEGLPSFNFLSIPSDSQMNIWKLFMMAWIPQLKQLLLQVIDFRVIYEHELTCYLMVLEQKI